MAMLRPRPAGNPQQGAQQVRTRSIPASVNGWNARDSVADMPPNMALAMTNLFPTPSDLVVRDGTTFWYGTFFRIVGNPPTSESVGSVMVYRPQSGSQKLFVAISNAIYDVTNSSASGNHGYQKLNPTGLLTNGTGPTNFANDATAYTATCTIDGTPHAISVTGSATQTIGQLVTQLRTQVGGSGVATVGLLADAGTPTTGRIVIVSTSTGATSSVLWADNGTNKLCGALNGTPGAALAPMTAIPGANAAVSGTSNGNWQYVNFAAGGNNYLMACNGVDSIRRYDSSNGWLTITGAGNGAITGVTTSTIVNIAAVHSRIWLVPVNSNQVYYLPVNSISGAAVALDLGPLMSRGGFVIAAGGWSMDAGVGMQEYTVFVTDQGQAIVYQGYDPSNAALWALVGVYDIGKPVGYRCMKRLGQDLLIMTTDGLVGAAKGFITARTNERLDLTTNIQNAVTTAINQYAAGGGTASTGWGVEFYPANQQLIINVGNAPLFSGGTYSGVNGAQFVMNTIHKAWCLFAAIPMQCMDIFNDVLYFGDINGNVAKMDSSVGTDYGLMANDVAQPIISEWQPAFNYLGSEDVAKNVTLVRPALVWTQSNQANMSLKYSVDADFVVSSPSAVVTLPTLPVSGANPFLNLNAVLGSTGALSTLWLMAEAVGYAVAPHFLLSSADSRTTNLSRDATHFNAIDIVYREAGVQVQS